MLEMRGAIRGSNAIYSAVQTVLVSGTKAMKYDYVAVVGESESGKSAFANALGNALGWQVAETGHVLDTPLAKILASSVQLSGIPLTMEQWMEEMRERKNDARVLKRTFGDVLCELDPGLMVRGCMKSGARVIVGARRPEEIRAMMAMLKREERMLLIILYRSQPVQPLSHFLSLQVPIIERLNDGTLDDLQRMGAGIALEIAK